MAIFSMIFLFLKRRWEKFRPPYDVLFKLRLMRLGYFLFNIMAIGLKKEWLYFLIKIRSQISTLCR